MTDHFVIRDFICCVIKRLETYFIPNRDEKLARRSVVLVGLCTE